MRTDRPEPVIERGSPDLYPVMGDPDVTRHGREQRFTTLFSECYSPVLAFARRRLEPDAAQDVVAETFLTAWRRLDEIGGEPLPWLYRIAGHAVANQRRGQVRRGRLADRARQLGEGVAPDPADGVIESRLLVEAFNALGERDREALRLVMWEGLPPKEAAFVLECSPATFTVRLHRARRRLARLLGEEHAGDPRLTSLQALPERRPFDE
jgi:RNA polymerase sigma factor (sigma-70 family)